MNSVAILAATGLLCGLIGIATDLHAQMYIYPEKGQTKDQQEFDQFTCNKWAKEQTGIDPSRQVTTVPPPEVRGPMRRRRAEMEYEQEVQAQAASHQADQKKFNRAYGVCLEGKGYKVG